jgi:hypothetical protein
MINELVKEYCIYRGLIGSGFQGRANGNSSLSVAMGTQSLSSPSVQQALDRNMAGNIFISSKSSHQHPHGVIGMGKLHDEALRTQSLSQEASSSQTENVEVSDVCMEEPEANATEGKIHGVLQFFLTYAKKVDEPEKGLECLEHSPDSMGSCERSQKARLNCGYKFF